MSGGLLMKKNLNKILFALVILIAIVLRFWQLGVVPPSPDWDEAALGYTAYSIKETGKDEYGKSFPVILRSYDDYKPALYAYLIIPFIKFLGLNIVSVRLPSAIFGVIAVISTYFLVRQLFDKYKDKDRLAILSSFLLAISPWHLHFSRIAFEAQVGLSMNILSILFFLKGLKNKIFLIPGVFFVASSIYVYQSEKVYLPILFAFFGLIYFREILKIPKKWLIGSLVLGLVLIAPMVHGLISDRNALLRARGVSVFYDQTQFLKKSAFKLSEDKKNNDILGLLVDNRRVEYGKAIISGYISHFDLNWLFVRGDIERHHAPGMGLMYLFELPFLLVGIYILFFWQGERKTKLTLFSILLISPIAASITSGVPHAVRNINFLPILQILVALGILTTFLRLKTYDLRRPLFMLGIVVYCTIVFANFVYFLNQYFVQQNYFYSESWQYGYKDAVEAILPIEKNYNKVIVSNDRPLDQSYMFFLFYLKYDPKSYLATGGTYSGGFREDHFFGKYEFREISWDSEETGNLYVGRPEDFPDGLGSIKTINYLDGEEAIMIVGK